MLPPLLHAIHNHPVRVCVTVMAAILPLVWMLAPTHGGML